MKDKIKVHIVSELYYPSETSTGYLLTKIAEGLVSKFDVNVITGPPSYTEDYGRYILQESINGVQINRINTKYRDKNSIVQRIIRLVGLSLKLFIRVMRHVKKNDRLLVVTNPAPLLLVISFLKVLKKNFKLIVLVHDVYPNNLVVAGIIEREGIFYRLIDYFYKRSLKTADHVVVLGRDMDIVIKKKGIDRTSIIENWSEIDTINAEYLNDTRKNCELDGPLNYLFAGNFGRVQGLSEFLQAAKETNPRYANFYFAGKGALATQVQAAANAYSDLITYQGGFIRSEQNDVLGLCDIGVVTLASGMYGLGVPSKAYNIMAAGKPILYIGDAGSELDLVINEYDCGWVLNDCSPRAIVQAIHSIALESRESILEKGRNSRYVAEAQYTLENAVSKYCEILA